MECTDRGEEFHIVTANEISFDYLCSTAECLKAIAHPARLQIILFITKGEFTVAEISQHCQLPQAQTSGHLRLMESKRLLNRERRGRKVFYSIQEPHLLDVMQCINGRYIAFKENLARS
jgi:DNA-binding transcriptional ArsR family regulator